MHRVVIIGGGFGGLEVARRLGDKNVDVLLIDRENHHLFQPLLYQVAICGLSPADIAAPIRSIVARHSNVRVVQANVDRIDRAARSVIAGDKRFSYDTLVVAVGAKTAYFGHEEWREHAPGLKSIDDALDIRRRVLSAFERAELMDDPRAREDETTFCVVGGGPTGVELAGAIAELARHVLAQDFRRIDPRKSKVVLIEGGAALLPGFTPALQRAAQEQLEELGVQIRFGNRVSKIDTDGVELDGERIRAGVTVWAAGVRANPLVGALGGEVDRMGRVVVGPTLSLPHDPRIFVIGDAASAKGEDGEPLPGVAPVAIQAGRYVAERILEGPGADPEPFAYRDRGIMATIGRSRAVAKSGRIETTGMLAWLAWLFIHLMFLVGFRNRIAVFLSWIWSYVTYERGARLITRRASHEPGEPPLADAARAREDERARETDGRDERSVRTPSDLRARRNDERARTRAN